MRQQSLKNVKKREVVKLPNVSVECLEAIELLLKKDPQERITIFDFLHHPWLQNYQRWKNKKLWPTSYSSDSQATSDLQESLSLSEQIEDSKSTLKVDDADEEEKVSKVDS